MSSTLSPAVSSILRQWPDARWGLTSYLRLAIVESSCFFLLTHFWRGGSTMNSTRVAGIPLTKNSHKLEERVERDKAVRRLKGGRPRARSRKFKPSSLTLQPDSPVALFPQ